MRQFPYSRDWAEDTYRSFCLSYPRAGNLLYVFSQLALEDGFLLSRGQCYEFLIESLRRKEGQRFWELFKRCAKYPKCPDLSRERDLARRLECQYYQAMDEKAQMELNFNN